MMMTMDMNNTLLEPSEKEFFAHLSNIIGFYLFISIADNMTHMYMPRNFTQFKNRERDKHILNYQNYFNEVLQHLHNEKREKAKASTTAVVEGEEAVVETPAYVERILTPDEEDIIMSIIYKFNEYIDKLLESAGQASPILVMEFTKNTQIKV
jgi:hypothetical protein